MENAVILAARRPATGAFGMTIALGHPLGTAGARIPMTLLHEMSRRNARRGIAASCRGGGQGTARAVERVDNNP